MAKTLLFTGFRSRHDLRFFGKRVNTSVLCVHQGKKIGSKSAKKVVIYRGLAPSRAKNCVNTSVSASKSCQNTAIYSVSCLPRFLEIAKTVEIPTFFAINLQKHWYLQCFVHLWLKTYWYLQHFLRFCMAPAKDVNTQRCCNLQHFVTFEELKIVRKMCQNGTFSDFRYPPNGGGGRMLLETLLSDPDSGQKAFPHPPEGFLVFFGAPHHRALVALGRS